MKTRIRSLAPSIVGLVSTALLGMPFSRISLHAQTPRSENVRDLSKLPDRTITWSIEAGDISWLEAEQRPEGAALAIEFSAPAAPLELIGKIAAPETVTLSPSVPGKWRWLSSTRLVFEAQGGWIPPQRYSAILGKTGFAKDAKIGSRRDNVEVTLTAEFSEQSYYIDPTAPTAQRAVTQVLFNMPVSKEEVLRHLKMENMSKTATLIEGSKPQVVADEKNPLRFFLRSPLMKPGDKEDLLNVHLTAGVTAIGGGTPLSKKQETKVPVPSRTTGFYFTSINPQLLRLENGEPCQHIFIESKGSASGKEVLKQLEVWQLPEPDKDKDGNSISWTVEKITPSVLSRSERIAMEYVPDADGRPWNEVFGFKMAPRRQATLFVRLPKDLPAPGGFVTPEDYVKIVSLPDFPRETQIVGKGGILAISGEKKLNILSRGYENLRYTLARVPVNQINHLVSQNKGQFDNPTFTGVFGMTDMATYSQSIQSITMTDQFKANYSSYDFSDLMNPANKTPLEAGLFFLSVQGVKLSLIHI